MLSLAKDVKQASATRADALTALTGLWIDDLESIARGLLDDSDAMVRNAARQTLAAIGTADAIKILAAAVDNGEPLEQQGALSVLAKQSDGSADAVIAKELDRLLAGKADPRIQLNAEGRMVSILQDDIEQRRPGKSAMPEDLIKHLSRFDLRDLIEYLSTLK